MSTQKQQILKRCDLFFLMHRRDIIIFTILLHAYHHTYNHHHHHDNHHSLPRHWLIMRFENWFWKLYHVETLYMQQLPDHGVKARLRLINLFLSMLNIFCHFIIFMQRTEITQNTKMLVDKIWLHWHVGIFATQIIFLKEPKLRNNSCLSQHQD